MRKKELKEIERNMMWGWLHEEMPKLFINDKNDDIGFELVVSIGSYRDTLSWNFEKEGGELIFVLGSDGTLSVTISEVCHETKTICLFNPEDDIDVEVMKADIYYLCTIFTSGNIHIFMDFLNNILNVADLRMSIDAYVCFEKNHPEILNNITYMKF